MLLAGVPNEWPRTLSVLGLGSICATAIIHVSESNLVQGHQPLEQTPWHSFSHFGLEAVSITAMVTLGFVFVAYLLGEIFMLLGMTYQKRSSVHLKRFSVVKFLQAEGNEVWVRLFSEAERKFELLSGISAAVLVLGCAIGVSYFFDYSWVHGVFTIIVSVLMSFFFLKLAEDSYLNFSEIMDAVDGFRSKDNQSLNENKFGDRLDDV
jgi:hypothetical protein